MQTSVLNLGGSKEVKMGLDHLSVDPLLMITKTNV